MVCSCLTAEGEGLLLPPLRLCPPCPVAQLQGPSRFWMEPWILTSHHGGLAPTRLSPPYGQRRGAGPSVHHSKCLPQHWHHLCSEPTVAFEDKNNSIPSDPHSNHKHMPTHGPLWWTQTAWRESVSWSTPDHPASKTPWAEPWSRNWASILSSGTPRHLLAPGYHELLCWGYPRAHYLSDPVRSLGGWDGKGTTESQLPPRSPAHFLPCWASCKGPPPHTPSPAPLHHAPPQPGPNRMAFILIQIHIVLAEKHQRGRVVTYSISERRKAAPCFINVANVDSCNEKCTNARQFLMNR